jgi:hypothetical protein
VGLKRPHPQLDPPHDPNSEATVTQHTEFVSKGPEATQPAEYPFQLVEKHGCLGQAPMRAVEENEFDRLLEILSFAQRLSISQPGVSGPTHRAAFHYGTKCLDLAKVHGGDVDQPGGGRGAVQNYRRKGSKWPVFEKRQHTGAIEVTEAEPICRPPGPGEVDLGNGTREGHSSFHDGRFYANAPADFDRWDELGGHLLRDVAVLEARGRR